MKNKVLIIGSHPDDETLSAGGTLLKYKAGGHKIFWLNITNKTEDFGFNGNEVEARRKEIKNVIKEYGFHGSFDLCLRPAGLDTYGMSFLVESISRIITLVKPSIVILPYRDDIHSDHRIVFEAGYSCIKFRHDYIKKVLMGEVISETDFAFNNCGFLPNYFVDITGYLDKKVKILSTYRSEIKAHPFPRSIEGIRALATLRGVHARSKYAEAFILLKSIE